MSWMDWTITLIPLIFVIGMGFYSMRYIRGVSDYLAAGRVAGRYVITVGDIAGGLAVITLIGYVEACYKTGFAMNFWNNILAPIGIVMGLTGFCTYRFRETKSMSLGQFLELRYNRSLRIYASALRSIAELLANCMCPALAARFMIYYLDFPQSFSVAGVSIPTFMVLTFIMITLCVLLCCLGGALSLLITDTIQGFFCYPLLILFAVFIVVKFSWATDIVPVMSDRVAGQSFLDPYDIEALRDFNLFGLVVSIYAAIINRANWIGTGGNVCAKSPHESKMAGIMGSWRVSFSMILYVLMVILVIVALNHPRMNFQAKEIRDHLSHKVLEEVLPENASLRTALDRQFTQMPPRDHVIGGERFQDKPLSHDLNLDTPHLQTVQQAFKNQNGGAGKYQEFYTLYHQMMLPVTLRKLLPAGMLGLFTLFLLLVMLSADDSRLFSAAQTIAQDCVMPFLKEGFKPSTHILAIRLTVIGCGIFWFIGSFFMAQLDYINMFVTIMCTLWIGAGPMMVFGLYSKFGNTTGAFSSLISGMVLALLFIFVQRNWATVIYPFLLEQGWAESTEAFFAACSAPFEPWIVWRVTPNKFPVNSVEINFIIMICCLLAYIIGSLVSYKAPFNLERMLHRGIYNTDGETVPKVNWSLRHIFRNIIGITPEFTRGDKIISWSVFLYSFVFQFFLAFVLVAVWNLFSPWKPQWWSTYFFVVYLIVPIIAAAITTVWFIIGGIFDMRQLFRDLKRRVDNPLDNGQVEGNVALSDKKIFQEREKEKLQ